MRKWKWPFFLFLPLVVILYLTLTAQIWANRAQIRLDTPAGYVMPSKFSRILAMGNKGILSDFIFLKTATFFGGKSIKKGALKKEDWQYIVKSLDVTTDLDPYFVDPYFLAEGLLAWSAGMPEEANTILIKGTKYRISDWRLPFFIGFNDFYFLHDYETASDYIMAASRIPNSPGFFPTLAARLAYYGGKSKTALLFLRQMLKEANNPVMQKSLELRLLALERAVSIEEALDKFKKDQKRLPTKLNELVTQGYLNEMPKDPYGGKWVILDNGRVFSTSKFVEQNENQ
jgi:tetratricopeptide (TPR) repeat protein